MPEHPFPEKAEIRRRVFDALILFHYADRLVTVRPDLTPERIAFEVCRLWFDRVFTPGLRYMDGYKGDADESASQVFIDAFSDEEYSWIERFHRFLELRVDRLSPVQRAEKIFPENDTWIAIRRDAGNLLDLMDGRRDHSQKRFEQAVRELRP